MSNEKVKTVAALLSSRLRSVPESEITPLAREIVESLAPRVFAHGEDIPPRTVVMDSDGDVHGHPSEDIVCYEEGFGAHLGWLVEVPNPDEWHDLVDAASAAREVSE